MNSVVSTEALEELIREIEEIVRSVPRIRGNLAAKFVREDRDRDRVSLGLCWAKDRSAVDS